MHGTLRAKLSTHVHVVIDARVSFGLTCLAMNPASPLIRSYHSASPINTFRHVPCLLVCPLRQIFDVDFFFFVEPAPANSTCDNGLTGIQDPETDVCCPLICGESCGGVGCGSIPGVDASDCCATNITDSGMRCSETVGPPCIVVASELLLCAPLTNVLNCCCWLLMLSVLVLLLWLFLSSRTKSW